MQTHLESVEQEEEDDQGEAVGLPGCNCSGLLLSSPPPNSFQAFRTGRSSGLATMHEARSVVSPVYLRKKNSFQVLPWQTLNWVAFQSHSNHPGRERASLVLSPVLHPNANSSHHQCWPQLWGQEHLWGIGWWNESPEFLHSTLSRSSPMWVYSETDGHYALIWALSIVWFSINLRVELVSCSLSLSCILSQGL